MKAIGTGACDIGLFYGGIVNKLNNKHTIVKIPSVNNIDSIYTINDYYKISCAMIQAVDIGTSASLDHW